MHCTIQFLFHLDHALLDSLVLLSDCLILLIELFQIDLVVLVFAGLVCSHIDQ